MKKLPWGELLAVLVFLLMCWLLLAQSAHAKPGQKQPEAKRVAQIHAALTEHGYISGSTWLEVQETCRRIADEHGWQINRAPDARVLILLGLGNIHSDSWVAKQPGTRLDRSQRHEHE